MMNSASDPFTYYLGDDSEEDTEHQAAHLRAGSSSQEPAGGGGRARRSNARHRRFSEACSSGDDGEDMEERMDYSRMTPESLKRVKRCACAAKSRPPALSGCRSPPPHDGSNWLRRCHAPTVTMGLLLLCRRVANRECARRIRQRKLVSPPPPRRRPARRAPAAPARPSRPLRRRRASSPSSATRWSGCSSRTPTWWPRWRR